MNAVCTVHVSRYTFFASHKLLLVQKCVHQNVDKCPLYVVRCMHEAMNEIVNQSEVNGGISAKTYRNTYSVRYNRRCGRICKEKEKETIASKHSYFDRSERSSALHFSLFVHIRRAKSACYSTFRKKGQNRFGFSVSVSVSDFETASRMKHEQEFDVKENQRARATVCECLCFVSVSVCVCV